MRRPCCRDPHGTEGGAAAPLPQPPSPLSFFSDRPVHTPRSRSRQPPVRAVYEKRFSQLMRIRNNACSDIESRGIHARIKHYSQFVIITATFLMERLFSIPVPTAHSSTVQEPSVTPFTGGRIGPWTNRALGPIIMVTASPCAHAVHGSGWWPGHVGFLRETGTTGRAEHLLGPRMDRHGAPTVRTLRLGPRGCRRWRRRNDRSRWWL